MNFLDVKTIKKIVFKNLNCLILVVLASCSQQRINLNPVVPKEKQQEIEIGVLRKQIHSLRVDILTKASKIAEQRVENADQLVSNYLKFFAKAKEMNVVLEQESKKRSARIVELESELQKMKSNLVVRKRKQKVQVVKQPPAKAPKRPFKVTKFAAESPTP